MKKYIVLLLFTCGLMQAGGVAPTYLERAASATRWTAQTVLSGLRGIPRLPGRAIGAFQRATGLVGTAVRTGTQVGIAAYRLTPTAIAGFRLAWKATDVAFSKDTADRVNIYRTMLKNTLSRTPDFGNPELNEAYQEGQREAIAAREEMREAYREMAQDERDQRDANIQTLHAQDDVLWAPQSTYLGGGFLGLRNYDKVKFPKLLISLAADYYLVKRLQAARMDHILTVLTEDGEQCYALMDAVDEVKKALKLAELQKNVIEITALKKKLKETENAFLQYLRNKHAYLGYNPFVPKTIGNLGAHYALELGLDAAENALLHTPSTQEQYYYYMSQFKQLSQESRSCREAIDEARENGTYADHDARTIILQHYKTFFPISVIGILNYFLRPHTLWQDNKKAIFAGMQLVNQFTGAGIPSWVYSDKMFAALKFLGHGLTYKWYDAALARRWYSFAVANRVELKALLATYNVCKKQGTEEQIEEQTARLKQFIVKGQPPFTAAPLNLFSEWSTSRDRVQDGLLLGVQVPLMSILGYKAYKIARQVWNDFFQ